LGIPFVTVKRHKVICDKCDGLGAVKLKHLPHEKCIGILAAQKKYLEKKNGVGDGSIRRVETEIRREQDRMKKLAENYTNRSVKIKGSRGSTEILKNIEGEVTRCHNAQNQQYEVKIKNPLSDDYEENLKRFYKLESTKYVKKGGTHYVYVQRQELEIVNRRRLASAAHRRLPENYAALRPSEQALARRRLVSRPKSHIVVLERLLEEINELNR